MFKSTKKCNYIDYQAFTFLDNSQKYIFGKKRILFWKLLYLQKFPLKMDAFFLKRKIKKTNSFKNLKKSSHFFPKTVAKKINPFIFRHLRFLTSRKYTC